MEFPISIALSTPIWKKLGNEIKSESMLYMEMFGKFPYGKCNISSMRF